MSNYLLKLRDGTVRVMYIIAGDVEGEIAKFPEDEQRLILSFREIDTVPDDRTFRNAWCDETDSQNIDIDMAKAKELALTKLRAARDAKLNDLDTRAFIAFGKNDQQEIARIESDKQKLRDATEPLKAIAVSGYNDKSTLSTLKELSTLEEV